MATYAHGCHEADYNGATNSCTTTYLVPMETGLPSLSIADAQQIGLAFALLLGAAWCVKQIARTLRE